MAENQGPKGSRARGCSSDAARSRKVPLDRVRQQVLPESQSRMPEFFVRGSAQRRVIGLIEQSDDSTRWGGHRDPRQTRQRHPSMSCRLAGQGNAKLIERVSLASMEQNDVRADPVVCHSVADLAQQPSLAACRPQQ